MTKISAIVPTYNRAGFLIEALKALLAQTRALHEIVVWDDGSTDHTQQAVADLGETPVPVRYFRDENGGKARALNRSLEVAQGDAIWICDDDDISRPYAAETMAATMEDTGDAVVAGRYLRFGTDPASGAQIPADPGYWPDLAQGSILRHLLEDIFLFQNATLVRREAYACVGGFREDLARSIDYDMIIRLAARYPVHYVDEILFDQRKHDGTRGPAAAAHAAKDMDNVWRRADQDVFKGFHEALPLSLYEAMFQGEGAIVARAARLQRAAVYARRDLWELALEDLDTAGAMGGDALTSVEMAICRRALAGKHETEGAFSKRTLGRLKALRRSGSVGMAIASGLALGMRWRARKALQSGQVFAGTRILRAMVSLGGLGSLANRAAGPGERGLSERSTLPAAAYDW